MGNQGVSYGDHMNCRDKLLNPYHNCSVLIVSYDMLVLWDRKTRRPCMFGIRYARQTTCSGGLRFSFDLEAALDQKPEQTRQL